MEPRKISEIKICERHRKDMGDIAGLAASIETFSTSRLHDFCSFRCKFRPPTQEWPT
jgi:hypothetical protein